MRQRAVTSAGPLRANDARLILLDGIPGSGKSVAAQTIARRLRDAGQPVRWWYEEERGHPVYVFDDQATLQATVHDLFSGAHERVVEAALQQWARFAHEVQRSAETMVVDGAYFGYLAWTLHYLDRPPDEILVYLRRVQEALAPLQTHLVYLRQQDVAATLRHVLAVRGAGWAAQTIRKAVESPYSRAHGLDHLDGMDGLIQFWSDYQALAERLFDATHFPKSAVDVSVGGWTGVFPALADFLDLPPAQTSSASACRRADLERFAGAYQAPDGRIAHVTLADDGLAVRRLRQVWPGQRLVPVRANEFEVLSLPFTIRFGDDVMEVEGPELFGGRPPAALVRMPE